MTHVFELASSGRAKCRGCEQKIAMGELRFGERQPNSFGDGEMTLWFHPRCAAYKRPEAFLEGLQARDAADQAGPDSADRGTAAESAPSADIVVDDGLSAAAHFGIAHRRLPRLNGANRAPTGRARCRSCRELIEKGSWRIGLVFFEEYRFQPAGFIHARCAKAYFDTVDLLERVTHFSPDLAAADIAAFKASLELV